MTCSNKVEKLIKTLVATLILNSYNWLLKMSLINFSRERKKMSVFLKEDRNTQHYQLILNIVGNNWVVKLYYCFISILGMPEA
jgi:hypothetical protein